MKVISLYTGAGGLDLGLEAAGFHTSVAVEMNDHAVRTLRANRPRWSVIHSSIHDAPASSANILQAGGLEPRQPTLLAGGPPCQPFSKNGYWHSGDAKRLNDPRAQTLEGYLRVLRDTLPRVFLLENVPGMAFSEKDEGLQLLRREIDTINEHKGVSYSFSAAQLNAAEYGIPQVRQRVIVVGHRDGKDFSFPKPTHALPPSVSMANGQPTKRQRAMPTLGLQQAITAWDAIGHLSPEKPEPELQPTGKWAGLLKSIPEGHNYLFHTCRGNGLSIFGWRTRYWSMLLKLAKNRPSWTLTAQPGPAIGPFHWENRRLSPRELAALQTFPADYEVTGPYRAVLRQLGNAVPSALAEVLGLEIRRQLLGEDLGDRAPSLVPTSQGEPPAPTPVDPHVEDRYRELVGTHASHPGTGLGPGAKRRLAS